MLSLRFSSRTFSLLTVIAAALFFAVFPALAAGLVTCTGIDCQACSLFQLIDRIIHFLIVLAVPIATLLFMYAGYLLVTGGGGEGSSTARKIFADVLWGLVLALLGFVIVDTVLKTLAVRDFAGPGWSTLQCVPRSPGTGGLTFTEPTITTTPSEDALVASNPTSNLVGATTPGTYDHTAALGVLTEAGGFTLSSTGNCSAQQAGCTSLQGVRQDTVNQIINFQQACGCQITITGGTEPGHSDGVSGHTQGYKVDIAITPQIDAYIQNNFRYSGLRPGDNATLYTDRYGNQYAREGNHWDIQIKGVGRYQ